MNVIYFKPRFSLFRLSKYYQILQKNSFCIGYCDILNKLATIVYCLFFMKETLELGENKGICPLNVKRPSL